MPVEKWKLGSVATLASTELNSLANNTNALASADYNNTQGGGGGDGYTRGQFELVVTFGTAPTANTTVDVYLLALGDGTNREDGSGSVTPARLPDVQFPVRAVNTAQRIVIDAPLPPGNCRALVRNAGTGQTFAASGNTLKVRPYTPEGA